jgi:hypothetical protein
MKRILALILEYFAFGLLVVLLSQCISQEEISLADPTTTPIATSTSTVTTCTECAYIVPATAYIVDGLKLGLQPGSIIGLDASFQYKNLLFRNIVGTIEKPIVIKNFGGTVTINGTGLPFSIKTETSKNFRITGGAHVNEYGIKLNGGHMGITLDKLSTNFEVDHVEIANSGFAGIMAKTDPSCDDATIRGNFLMERVSLHHNYIHDTGGEGIYAGNSYYENGMNTACGLRLPHEIHNIRIFDNKVINTGWDGIQLACATKVAHVYANTIENFGVENVSGQRNGLQLGAGTGGYCYGNFIRKGNGNGIAVFGLGDNIIHNNIIVNAGEHGIFCDERYTPGPGFKFINNTIVSPKLDGIRLYSEKVPMNTVINNIIANPGSYSTYVYPRSSADSFIFKITKTMPVDASNNFLTTNIPDVKFLNPDTFNYRLVSTSPIIDAGRDISSYNINKDYYRRARLNGTGYDIGASEYY